MATRAAKQPDRDPASRTERGTVKPAVIPVIQEQATISKRIVETGKVRISKQVREYEEVVDVPHYQEEVRVERVPINEFVEAAPSVRTEGDVTIIPIIEERYVMEKRLFVAEELHIRKDRIESHSPQTLKVLKEEVEVTRLSPAQVESERTRAAKPRQQK